MKRVRRGAAGQWSLAALAALLLAGCSRPAAQTSADTPRLVSTAPNLTEIVCAIGAGGHLVGRSSACDYPPEELARVPVTGDYARPWLEPLLAQRPTHVLAAILPDPGTRERLTAAGLHIVQVQCARLAEIPDAIRQLGLLTARGPTAEALALKIETGTRAAQLATRTAHDKPRALLLFAPETPITAGRDAFIATLLALAGGQNLGRDSASDYYHVSLEWVLQQDPDLIICVFETKDRDPAALFERRLGWKSLRAVRQRQVYTLTDLASASRPGPRVLEGLAQFKEVLRQYAAARENP